MANLSKSVDMMMRGERAGDLDAERVCFQDGDDSDLMHSSSTSCSDTSGDTCDPMLCPVPIAIPNVESPTQSQERSLGMAVRKLKRKMSGLRL
mmetsp:Transcript_31596/g.67160  ORF Transcript_31596/g.67160 Transcript_31596/m.67160 type:complete len:93 (+) Transcript_31596:70-348(+)